MGDWAYGSQYHLVRVTCGARSSHSAVSAGAYKGRKLRYKYSSARPHGLFSASVPRNDVNRSLNMLLMKACRNICV